MQYVRLNSGRARVYRAVAIALLAWALFIVFFAAAVVNLDTYLFSYYAFDYEFGFVRRGLAGEIINLFPVDNYFDGLRIMRWAPTGVYLASLSVLASLVLFRGERSERRIMLALLIPVLPFGVAFAVYSARPDLFGATALVAYAISVFVVKSPRAVGLCSIVYGISIGVLGLVHEAITLEFSLGAILAILVLARHLTTGMQRLNLAFTVLPGLVVAFVVSVFGQPGLGTKLCTRVPHKDVGDITLKMSPERFIDYFFRGHQPQIDYSDWLCRTMAPTYDYSVGDAIRVVGSIGFAPLLASLIFGISIIVLTIYLVSYFSGVPFRQFFVVLKGNMIWPLLGLALMVPVFLTGFDWARWCIVIALNIVVVYILYTLEVVPSQQEPTSKKVRAFVLVVAALALLPIGVIPGAGPTDSATSPGQPMSAKTRSTVDGATEGNGRTVVPIVATPSWRASTQWTVGVGPVLGTASDVTGLQGLSRTTAALTHKSFGQCRGTCG